MATSGWADPAPVAPRSDRAQERVAAASCGWSVVEPGDVAAVAWTRALFWTPGGARRPVHGLLAALCWPAFALGLLLMPSGWFHRDERRTAVLLHRRHQMRGWLWVAFFLGIHVVVRALAAVVGDVVLFLLGATLAYAAVVLTCIGLRRRELRPPEERRGYIRARELPTTSWLLVRVEHREGLLEPVMPQVLALIAARVPPGAVVGAAPSYDQLERDLISIGFAPVPDARGRVALTVPTS